MEESILDGSSYLFGIIVILLLALLALRWQGSRNKRS